MATGDEQLVVIAGYASPADPGVRLATFDSGTGDLRVVAELAGIADPSYVVAHPQHPWLYAASEVGDASLGGEGAEGAVVGIRLARLDRLDRLERLDRLDRRRPTLELDAAARQPSGGGLPCHLELAPSGRWVVASNYGTGSVEVVAVNGDGSLGAVADRDQHSGSGVRPDRQECPHAHAAAFTPDRNHVLVNDLGTDEIVIYRFDDERGSLARTGVVHASPGAGPRHLAFHPDGRRLYVVNELASTVTTYGYEGGGVITGPLDELDTRGDPADRHTVDNTPAAIAAVAVNQRLYVSNRGDDTIAAFDMDLGGRLHLAGVASSGGHWPRDFAVDRSGRWMLVAHQFGGTVAVLPLSAAAPVGERVAEIAVPGASCIQFLGPAAG